jgi:FkbM family methyltransferase
MNPKALARRAVQRGIGLFAARSIFSNNRRLRSVGFDVISKHQRLVACAPAEGEQFVVHAGDEWIGRGLFVSGEFDFDKFVAALAALAEARPEAKPKLLVDVGANIGSICIPAVARGYVDRVIAVEPDPLNSRLLRANVALNGLEAKVRTVETAAGAADGERLELELSGSNLGDHRIRVSQADGALNEAGRDVVTVASSTLDSICAGEPTENMLVWMDVQGFEGIALTGARTLLDRRVPMVLEFCPYMMARAQSFGALKTALAGYEGFVDLDSRKGVRPIEQLDALYDELGEGQAFTDILVL